MQLLMISEFEQHLKIDKNGNRIGKFAIVTNTGLSNLVGNLLQDEKFSGIHVAFGHEYPEKTGSDWNSDIHVDAVLRNCTITVENKVIMKDEKFLI